MAIEPITEAEAKRHLRLDDDDPGVTDVPRVITAARQAVEQYLATSIVDQRRVYHLDRFPGGLGWIRLPNGPVDSITSIAYVDADGNDQSVNEYQLATNRLDDILAPAFGENWPSSRDQFNAVTITYQAGMMAGSPPTLEHEDIKQAILLTLGDFWEHRESQFVGVSVAANMTVTNLLHFHRRELGT